MNPPAPSAAAATQARLKPMAPPAARAAAVAVCPIDRLTPNRGVAALIAGRAIAIFRLDDDRLFALDNVDPFCGASVMSRGIVGDLDGTCTVASPMYKQRFCLATGRCLDDPSVSIGVHDIGCVDGQVVVRVAA